MDRHVSTFKTPEGLNYRTYSLKNNPNQIIEGSFELIDSRFYQYRSLPRLREGNNGTGRVWCLRDVTQQKKNVMAIEH